MHQVHVYIFAIELLQAVLECLPDAMVRIGIELCLNDELRTRNLGILRR